MKTLRMKLTLGFAILALAATALGLGAGDTTLARKVNEYEGQHRLHSVNEYEGQYLAQAQQGDPSQWG